jgi:hypothetical protein
MQKRNNNEEHQILPYTHNMKHSIIIKEHHINFYIGSCQTCKGLKQVKNSRKSVYCLDCINRKVENEGYNKTNKIHPILVGMTSKQVYKFMKTKKCVNINLLRKERSHTCWEKINKNV